MFETNFIIHILRLNKKSYVNGEIVEYASAFAQKEKITRLKLILLQLCQTKQKNF